MTLEQHDKQIQDMVLYLNILKHLHIGVERQEMYKYITVSTTRGDRFSIRYYEGSDTWSVYSGSGSTVPVKIGNTSSASEGKQVGAIKVMEFFSKLSDEIDSFTPKMYQVTFVLRTTVEKKLVSHDLSVFLTRSTSYLEELGYKGITASVVPI